MHTKSLHGKPLFHTDQNSACFWETPICDHKEVVLGLCKHNCFHLSPRQPSTALHTWVSGGEKEKIYHLLMINAWPLEHSGERTNRWLPVNICR